MEKFTTRFRRSALSALLAMLVLAAGCGKTEDPAMNDGGAPETTPAETVAPDQTASTPAVTPEPTPTPAPLAPGQDNQTALTFGETYRVNSVKYYRDNNVAVLEAAVEALKNPETQQEMFVHLVRGDGEAYGIQPVADSPALPTEAGQTATVRYAIDLTPEMQQAELTGFRFGFLNPANQQRMLITTPDPRMEGEANAAFIKL